MTATCDYPFSVQQMVVRKYCEASLIANNLLRDYLVLRKEGGPTHRTTTERSEMLGSTTYICIFRVTIANHVKKEKMNHWMSPSHEATFNANVRWSRYIFYYKISTTEVYLCNRALNVFVLQLK